MAGDFGAKKGSGRREFSENIGRYGKRSMNSSRSILLETYRKHYLILTNTQERHGQHPSETLYLKMDNQEKTQ